MDKQQRDAAELVKKLPIKEKIKHFWYYYKVHTIVAALLSVVVIWTLADCAMQEKYDLSIAYYSTRHVPEENLAKLETEIEKVICDINKDDSYNALLNFVAADISAGKLDELVQSVYAKIGVEVAANEYKMYILDKAYMDLFSKNYAEVTESVVQLSSIPDVKELLGLVDGEELYLVTMPMYDQFKDNEEVVAEHNNAWLVQKYFEQML